MVVHLYISNSKIMKKKILFIPFVILIVVALDLVNRSLCLYSFNHVQEDSRVYYQHIYHLNNRQSDILIAGASNGMHSYIPSIISDSLKMSCFNSSQDGRNISYQYFCLKKALENGPVRKFLLDLGEAQISKGWRYRTEYYQTYYWQNVDAREYMQKIGEWYLPFKMASSFIQYNNKFFVALYNYLPMGKLTEDGYVPLPYTGKPFNDIAEPQNDSFTPDSLQIEYLDKIVSCCKENSVELIILASPRITYSAKFIEYITDYCTKNKVTFINSVSSIEDRTMFKDFAHLNDNGARLYTNEIVKYLKQ